MAEKYVSNGSTGIPAGSNGFPGTVTQPYLTVAYAVTQIAAGDTLYIRDGVYAEGSFGQDANTLPSGTSWANPVTIRNYPGETVVFRPTSGDACIGCNHNEQYIIFKEFYIDGANVRCGVSINPIHGVPNHLRFESLDIYGAQAMGMYLDGNNHFVIDTWCHDNGFIEHLVPNHGFYVYATSTLFYRGGAYNNSDSGMQLYGPGFQGYNTVDGMTFFNNQSANGTGGLLITGPGDIVRNCVSYGNLTQGFTIGVSFGTGASSVQFYNNTAYGNGGTGIWVTNSSTNASVVNNLSYGNVGSQLVNAGDGSNTLTSNQTSDPSWVNSGAHNFHLATGSSAIGAGQDLSAFFSTDFDGVTRSAPWDIGAFAYLVPGGVTTGPALIANAVLCKITRNDPYSWPGMRLSIHTGPPGLTGANEQSGGWAARVDAGTSMWSAAANRKIATNAPVTWIAGAATTITHMGIWAGSILMQVRQLSSPAVLSPGKTLRFAAGTVVFDFPYGFVTPSATLGCSEYLANLCLDWMFRGIDFDVTPVKHALFTANPGITGANEVAGGSYTTQTAAVADWPMLAEERDSGYLINLRFGAQIDHTGMPTCRVTHGGLKSASDVFLVGGFAWGDPNGAQQFQDFEAGETATLNPATVGGCLSLAIVLNN